MTGGATLAALSDAAIAGVFAVFVAIVGAAATVTVALLNRSTKQEARHASAGVAELAQEFANVVRREHNCLDSLERAFDRIAILEEKAGLPPSPMPTAVAEHRRQHDRP